MRKLILLAVFVVVAMATAKGQTYTVVDTLINNDQKWQVVEQGLNRISNTLVKIFDQEKVATDTITHAQQTVQLMNYFTNGLNQYKQIWINLDTLLYTRITVPSYQISTGQNLTFDYFLNGNDSTNVGLIHEWDGLNARIEELQNDPDIKYLDAVSEFKLIKERQALLENRYQQINNQ